MQYFFPCIYQPDPIKALTADCIFIREVSELFVSYWCSKLV